MRGRGRRRVVQAAVLALLLTMGWIVAAAAADSQAIDLTGTWSCCGAGGAASQTFSITDSGGSLSGSASDGEGVFASISGSVSGDSVRIVTTYTGSSYVATFVGSVNGTDTEMGGNWSSTAGQSGTWGASREGSPPGGSTTTDDTDCLGGCQNFDFDYPATVTPGVTNLTIPVGCGSASPARDAVIATVPLCLPGFTMPADFPAPPPSLFQLDPAVLQQLVEDLAGAGSTSPPQTATSVQKAANPPPTTEQLQDVDSETGPEFGPGTSSAIRLRTAVASAVAGAAPTFLTEVIDSIAATHPSRADIAAFAQAVTEATASADSTTRALARYALVYAYAIGRRAIAYAIHVKSVKQITDRKLPVLASVRASVSLRSKSTVTLRPTALGGRVIRLYEIVGLSRHVTLKLKVNEYRSGTSRHYATTRTIMLR
jgi:hypothetical protein